MSHLKFHHRSLYFMNSPEFLVYLVNDGYLFAKGLGDSTRLFHTIVWSTDGEGNGNPLQYSCLENPMDRGDW